MKKILGLLIALAVLAMIIFMIIKEKPQQASESPSATAKIEVVQVGELAQNMAPIVAYGQVVSSNSVAVVPETSGVVKRVYKTLGQTVRAGETVIELQNSSEQQAVLQARSSLSSSQASLSRVLRGANDDQVISAEAAVSAAENGFASAETTILSSLDVLYTELNSLISSDLSEFFNSPNSTSPSFTQNLNSTDQEVAIEDKLEELNRRFDQDRQYEDIDEALGIMLTHINSFQDFINDFRQTLTTVQASASLSQITIDRWDTDLVTTRNTLESKKVTVKGLEAQLASAQNSLNSAQAALIEIKDGADVEDVTIAESGVSASSAGLSSAQIQLSKTIIKAPTFGKISSIETKVGELVGPTAPIFVLSSSDTKRIDVFLTEKDVARLAVGSSVMIDGQYEGSIARIAPTIDSQTGKIKVEIFANEQITLTEGVGVGVSIESGSSIRGFAIPIEAVFVRGDQAYVYAVIEDRAVATPVETDGLFGPIVVVTEGIGAETKIATFARIIKDNQVITQ